MLNILFCVVNNMSPIIVGVLDGSSTGVISGSTVTVTVLIVEVLATSGIGEGLREIVAEGVIVRDGAVVLVGSTVAVGVDVCVGDGLGEGV